MREKRLAEEHRLDADQASGAESGTIVQLAGLYNAAVILREVVGSKNSQAVYRRGSLEINLPQQLESQAETLKNNCLEQEP